MIGRLFTDHPRSVGESYVEHARTAAHFGTAMLLGGAACLVHAVIPAWCTRTGSNTVRKLHAEMTRRNAAAVSEGSALVYEI
jgi:hypothetical protein